MRRLQTRGWEVRLGVLGALAIGVLLGTLISNGVRAARELDTAAAGPPLAVASPAELSATFREIAKRVEPAVVNISTESVVTTRRGRAPEEVPDPFRDFFDRFFDVPEQFTERSLGSGVIVDPSGFILTNYHVVEGADKIRVRLSSDGNKEFPAKVVGFDEETDLAVVKIDADKPLTAVPLGNSEEAQVGDWVLAIGSPFGLDATVTAGIISYKGRPGMQQFQRFIQTDAAINRGNSGGPLVNLAGQVIGINTAIVSSQGVYAGVGFALPSSIAVEVYNQIVRQGRVVRGSIGIRFRAATSENEAVLRSLGADHGVVVDEVVPGGPADKAGLRRGDVIVQVEDLPVRTGDELVNKIASTPVGRQLHINYIRDKKEQETRVSIEERTRVFPELVSANATMAPGEESGARLGLSLEELNPSTARRLGLESDQAGLLVRDVEPGSFAEDIGLERGDVILEFNHRRVTTLAEFNRLQRGVPARGDVVFWVQRRARGGWTGLYLGGTLSE
jgi:serine protease Do